MPSRSFSYMHLGNLETIENLYEQFLADPSKIEPTWRSFFEGMEFGEQAPKEEAPSGLRIFRLIDAYRRYGYLQAFVNPIAIDAPPPARELLLATLGFQENERNKPFPTCGLLPENEAPLSRIIRVLDEIYCSTKGVEYMGKISPEFEKWLQERIEPTLFQGNFTIEKKRWLLDRLNRAEVFEVFLHTKYVGQKRFSLEGGETLIPILSEIIDTGAKLGMDEFVLGMSHRGRLNVLANILSKSFSAIFGEFEDYIDPSLSEGTGDVKYHRGFSANVETTDLRPVHISLTANASHLESVDGIVQGKVRAKQIQRQDTEQKKVVPILIHGDASLAGQGVVYETLQFYKLAGYGNGGTIHIVVNNQIGFTTLPWEYASTHCSSDIANGFGFPVFRVNAEDPEGCIFVAQLATEIRQLFHTDVFIELVCYRKYGHNESDEPAFTQPLEYQLIRKKKSIREIYVDMLIHQQLIEREIATTLADEYRKELHFALEEFKVKKEIESEPISTMWKEYRRATEEEIFTPIETAVNPELLNEIGEGISYIPDGFELHAKLKRLAEQRLEMAQGRTPIDWATAELFAFGSLLLEKTPVRLSGQDSGRGTFTQRHAIWVDQKTDRRYIPLANLRKAQEEFTVLNSSLSEFGVLAFEFGYSLSHPASLTLWEAQFGDFANGGQVVFDQYISASAQKWNRYSGLVVLLPHGYEGQGPEHSSARIERFLQLSGEDNMQVTYPTTPAQYFHLLRRQVKWKIRLPLIVFTPKGLLRHSQCVSSIEAFSQGTFQEVLDDDPKYRGASRLLLCTGKVYYELTAEREKRKKNDVAIIRLEQLYPLQKTLLESILAQYKNAKEFFWVQEEPQNMGAFHYLYPELQKFLYIGRKASAATAAGSHAVHAKEQAELLNKAFE